MSSPRRNHEQRIPPAPSCLPPRAGFGPGSLIIAEQALIAGGEDEAASDFGEAVTRVSRG